MLFGVSFKRIILNKKIKIKNFYSYFSFLKTLFASLGFTNLTPNSAKLF
jgi:hypothetical protein